MTTPLWTPAVAGDVKLEHRLVMAPMTRSRATPDGVPTALTAAYYAQRASLGLLISEGTQPSADGQGYLLTPGMHTDEQVAGWRRVTDAVHAAGGRLFVQLMHVGRISHPDNTPHGRQPVAPSAVAPAGTMFTATGPRSMPVPRSLTVPEIEATQDDFRRAAAAAIDAGADGVEIHAANGYLIHQFLSDNANQRTDEYGGSAQRRIRFAVEVAQAVAAEIGAARTGIRIAPGNPFNDIIESNPRDVYGPLLSALAPLDLAYLHLVHPGDEDLARTLRAAWPGTLIVNRGGADLQTRVADIEAGLADLVSVGAMALANPDLPERLRAGATLNTPDRATFYGGDHRGYTDYPRMQEAS
ncbi:alkene reductase [Cryptosporangium aurantiacum]|uniref:N-ethylmaleimide reductase n=1 Tax=Cryptosporangium aurantiacum TaxID=134849 RepID=A0A1M7REJ5_9ACTN|nr:alkene reductase [Cryptosporangium aurantiacum]SHN44703.1 N-ethylmaleimide reductase [Cryptosporangium aurantiacum]